MRPGPNESIPLHLGVLALVAGFVWWIPVAAILAIPALAWVGARWLVMFLSWYRRRVREVTWKPWNGRYYAFEGQQIRLHPAANEIWIHADDLFAVLELEIDSIGRRKLAARCGTECFRKVPEIGGEYLSAAAALQFLAAQGNQRAQKLKRWFEREILPPLRRQNDSGGEAQA